jgi:beta-xylosidase
VVENDGRFYLYYSMGGIEPERFELRVGISQNPAGPYTDASVTLRDCTTNRFTIDAFPFRDDGGQWCLFYTCNVPFAPDGERPGTAIKVDRRLNMTALAG